MSAHADDLRYFYSEALGATVLLSVSTVSAVTPELEPGRYRVRYLDMAGATKLWLRQGDSDSLAATAAVPSTPFALPAAQGELFITTARATTGGGPNKGSFIAALTDAGTLTLVLTKISRGKN